MLNRNLHLAEYYTISTSYRPGHVARAGHDLVVVEETAARQVPGVTGQFPADAHITLAGLEAVD